MVGVGGVHNGEMSIAGGVGGVQGGEVSSVSISSVSAGYDGIFNNGRTGRLLAANERAALNTGPWCWPVTRRSWMN